MKMVIHTHRLIKKAIFAFLISAIVLASENLLAKESISEENKILIEKVFDLVDEEYIDSTDENDLEDCNTYIITVPTPIDSYKVPDLQPLLAACETAGKILKENDIVISLRIIHRNSFKRFHHSR